MYCGGLTMHVCLSKKYNSVINFGSASSSVSIPFSAFFKGSADSYQEHSLFTMLC